jgi:hypothetical protein
MPDWFQLVLVLFKEPIAKRNQRGVSELAFDKARFW